MPISKCLRVSLISFRWRYSSKQSCSFASQWCSTSTVMSALTLSGTAYINVLNAARIDTGTVLCSATWKVLQNCVKEGAVECSTTVRQTARSFHDEERIRPSLSHWGPHRGSRTIPKGLICLENYNSKILSVDIFKMWNILYQRSRIGVQCASVM